MEFVLDPILVQKSHLARNMVLQMAIDRRGSFSGEWTPVTIRARGEGIFISDPAAGFAATCGFADADIVADITADPGTEWEARVSMETRRSMPSYGKLEMRVRSK